MFNLPEVGFDFFGSQARKHNKYLSDQKSDKINEVSAAGDSIVNNLNAFNKDSEQFTKDTLGKEYTNKMGQVESGYNQTKADALTQASKTGAGVSSTSMNAQTKIESQKQKDLFNTDLSLQQKAINQANAEHEQAINNASREFSFINSIAEKDERGVFGKLFETGMSALGATIPFMGK